MQSLFDVAPEYSHTFVIFGHTYRAATERSTSERTGCIARVAFPRASLVEHAIMALRRDFPWLRARWPWESSLDRAARKHGIEVLWTVGFNPIFTELPYITVVWDLQHRLQPWFPEVSVRGEWDARELTYSWFLRRASVVITGTKVGQKELEQFYQIPLERTRVLPYPTPSFALSAGETSSAVLKKYGIPENYLFYPAQFWAHKNHANLLLALRQLREDYRLSFPVVFVGSDQGNLSHVKQMTNNLHLDSQAHILSFVPQEDLIALYKNAFALSYVSFFGPDNLPPLEAFALGCPVIASKVPGAEEQLGDAALLVDPRYPDDIALAIKSLYMDRQMRNTLVQRGFKRASEWTGRDYVRGVFQILDEFEGIRRCWGKFS